MTEIFLPLKPRPHEDPAAAGVVQANLEYFIGLFQKGQNDGDTLVWDSDLGKFVAASILPAGIMTDYGGAGAPAGWLPCDGAAVSRTTYAALFLAIGVGHGVGDGSTTFNVPDCRGRVTVGLGTHASVDTLSENDGTALADRRPHHRHTAHTHGVNYALSDVGGSNAAVVLGDATTPFFGQPTTSVDGGSAVATDPLNTPAYIVVNKIIKT